MKVTLQVTHNVRLLAPPSLQPVSNIVLVSLFFRVTLAAQGLQFSGNVLTREAWNGPVNGYVSYSYDNDLAVTSRRINNRAPIAFSYDPDKLLTHAGDLSIARSQTNGLITNTTLGNVIDSWSYNEFGELTNYSAVFGTNRLFLFELDRDALGRIITKTETIVGLASQYAYAYDLAGRLADVTSNGLPVSSYTYDNNDNRLGGGGGTSTYDPQDRLLSQGTIVYSYAPNGELAARTNAIQTDSYQYDTFGNLIDVVLPTGTMIRYLVDGRNRRIGKTINGTLMQGFLYDKSRRLIAELDASGNVISEFVYGTQDHAPDYLIKGGQTYRIISDHLGSPRLVVNVTTGQIAQRMDYDSFGRVLNDTAPGFQPLGFAAGLYDRDTGLVRFTARDYNPEAGRWTAKDPMLFAGEQPNLYTYASNDPVNRIDPRGLQSKGGQCLPISPKPHNQPQPSKDKKPDDKKPQNPHKQQAYHFSSSSHGDDDDLEDLEIQR